MTHVNRASLPLLLLKGFHREIQIDSAFSIPHSLTSLLFFVVAFAGIVRVPLESSLVSEFKPNRTKVGSHVFLIFIGTTMTWKANKDKVKLPAWLSSWRTVFHALHCLYRYYIMSPSSHSIPKAKKVSGCVGWSYTKTNCFKGVFRKNN